PKAYRNPWPGVVARKPEQPASPKAPGPASTEDLLAEPQYFFSGDGELAFLLVRPKDEKDALLGAHESVEALRGLVEEVRPAFAVMLFGMGDYGVLWVTRYNQERAAGLEVIPALRVTAAVVGPSTLTAAVTTGVAFFAAKLADFMAVSELGWVAGCGVLLCALSCFTVLPALIVLVDRRRIPASGGGSHSPLAGRVDRRDWLPALARRPGWVLAAGLLLVALLSGFAFHVHYDHNLLKLQASELESVRWEK